MKNQYFCKFVCYSGWIAAVVMAAAAFLCELRREIAVEHAGLLRANLGSSRAKLNTLELILKKQLLAHPNPFSHVGRSNTIE